MSSSYPHLYLIGLTGNIACGKSTVLRELEALGAATCDADAVVRALQAPGQPVYHAILAAFGPEMATEPGGPLDRARLGGLVFRDAAKLRQLEALVHPAVRAALDEWLRGLAPTSDGARRVAVIDAIKLIENNWPAVCDAVWVVTCPPAQQLERLMQTRGLSEEEAQVRIDAQPPQSEKVARADVVIDNGGALEATLAQVRAAWAHILSL
jgi:dephospho-CoA kinase